MKKVQLLIADDEDSIRNALCHVVKWEEEGIQVCASVKNGQEAYEVMRKQQVDIAILDIRMPLMSGLDVARKIKQEQIDTKVIILSGYDDFNYAKEALLQGAVNYLLKPCTPQQILEAVKEVCSQLEHEHKEEANQQSIKKQLEQREKEIQYKKVLDLIFSTNQEYMRDIMKELGLEVKDSFYVVLIHTSNHDCFTNEVRQVFEKNFTDNMDCIVGGCADQIVLIVNESSQLSKSQLRNILIKMIYYVKDRYQYDLNISVGSKEHRLTDIKKSWSNAVKAADMSYFIGNEHVYFYDSIYSNEQWQYPVEKDNQIIEAIRQLNQQKAGQLIKDFFHDAKETDARGTLIKDAIGLLLSLYHFTVSMGLDDKRIFGEPLELMNHVQQCRTTMELVRKLNWQSNMIIEQLSEDKTNNRFVNSAIVYIRKNYQKDLNLKDVAEELSITAGYLSTLFKQQTGESFVNYLNQIRIEKACELLKNLNLKNYEIAYQVGYQDEKYFTKVFKKIKGINPSQYRKGI